MGEIDHYFCSNPPQDAISRIQFVNNPQEPQIFVSSWDGKCYMYNYTDGSLISSMTVSSLPILSSCLCPKTTEGTPTLFACGGLSCEVILADLNYSSEATTILGQHDGPVRCIEHTDQDVIFTGSWDKTVKSWDLRTKSCTNSLSLDGKVFAMAVSASAHKLVICDSIKNVVIYDTRNLSTPTSVRDSKIPVLKSQLRAVECFPDGTGYAVACVEGRVSWEYFDPALGPSGEKKNYAFKCHREKSAAEGREIVYPVNVVAFHPLFHSFATGGGDGAVIVWDGYNKKRLWKTSELYDGSIFAVAFHPEEPLMVVGISEGKTGVIKANTPAKIAIRHLQFEDVTPKTKNQKN